MVDAKATVDLASGWTNVRDLREITSESGVINLPNPRPAVVRYAYNGYCKSDCRYLRGLH